MLDLYFVLDKTDKNREKWVVEATGECLTKKMNRTKNIILTQHNNTEGELAALITYKMKARLYHMEIYTV